MIEGSGQVLSQPSTGGVGGGGSWNTFSTHHRDLLYFRLAGLSALPIPPSAGGFWLLHFLQKLGCICLPAINLMFFFSRPCREVEAWSLDNWIVKWMFQGEWDELWEGSLRICLECPLPPRWMQIAANNIT